MDADWFEFNFVNDPDPAQPGPHPYFTIMLWKEGGKRLKFRLEGEALHSLFKLGNAAKPAKFVKPGSGAAKPATV